MKSFVAIQLGFQTRIRGFIDKRHIHSAIGADKMKKQNHSLN